MTLTNEIIDEKQTRKFCPKCGSLLPSPEVKFCPNCGCRMGELKNHENEKQIHKPSTQKKSAFPVILIIICVIGAAVGSIYLENIDITSTTNTQNAQVDNTTETVYTTPNGLEIRICDNGIAYVGGSKGKWDNNGYARIGYNTITFINIMLDGYNTYCSICEGQLYWGGHSVVVRDYPDGTPLQVKRQ